ncbi:aminoglycoside phosphotransferase family protein [Oceanobacillus senegalensis]|uniref:aminoglycoside phosphotransferase family protein n=1 Tax=Oceanobacillus senegalensis TaxID=1936063 RepID=UPI000A3059D8|nr:aminoglycoside phosphotransferase family protein [Oceanobacillus senegalensis]
MENKERLPSNKVIRSAYENHYKNGRQVIKVDLVSSTPKIRKMIAEYLVTYRTPTGEVKKESLIGKVYSNVQKGIDSYQFLKYLWENGFRSNPQFTVVRPIAYLKKWGLMIMSKSPGKTVDDWMYDPKVDNKQLASLIAYWMSQMHAIPLTEIRKKSQTRANSDIRRFYEDLEKCIPKEQSRLRELYHHFMKESGRLNTDKEVLLHGDFHTKNVFMHKDQVIAIDFDHHFDGDPAWDVAYFACQIQVSSFIKKGDFDFFQPMVKHFITKYLELNPSYNRQAFLNRLALYSARSLFESLHYELCVLNTGKFHIVDAFLSKCEQYLQRSGYQ